VPTGAAPASLIPVVAVVFICGLSDVLINEYFYFLRKNKETRLDAFKMKGLRKILRVSWTAKKTNEWVLNKAGVKRELLDTVKARKLAY